MEQQAKWLGWLISGLTALLMIANGISGLLRPDLMVAAMAGDGWPPETVFPIAVLSLSAGILYAIPQTAILGAILITAFCGGALAVHLRVTMDLIWPEVVNLLIAIAAWAGLFLRDQRFRDLLLNRR